MIIGLPPAGAGLACSALAAVVIVRDDAPAGPRDPAATAPTVTLAFTRRGDHIDVRVRDPLADPARYRAEFAAHGLKVELSLVPASPSIVGTVIIRRPLGLPLPLHLAGPGQQYVLPLPPEKSGAE